MSDESGGTPMPEVLDALRQLYVALHNDTKGGRSILTSRAFERSFRILQANRIGVPHPGQN